MSKNLEHEILQAWRGTVHEALKDLPEEFIDIIAVNLVKRTPLGDVYNIDGRFLIPSFNHFVFSAIYCHCETEDH